MQIFYLRTSFIILSFKKKYCEHLTSQKKIACRDMGNKAISFAKICHYLLIMEKRMSRVHGCMLLSNSYMLLVMCFKYSNKVY